jgi:hypothetical protein
MTKTSEFNAFAGKTMILLETLCGAKTRIAGEARKMGRSSVH